MTRFGALLGLGLVSALPAPALACSPPPPALRLQGESDADYQGRREALETAQRDEDRRRYQVALFDQASRVTLGRITSINVLEGRLPDGSAPRWVEVEALGAVKGVAAKGTKVAMRDVDGTSCGLYGGGSVTRGSLGQYALTFENVRKDGTGHEGILLRELREPRIIARLNEVVQAAGLMATKP